MTSKGTRARVGRILAKAGFTEGVADFELKGSCVAGWIGEELIALSDDEGEAPRDPREPVLKMRYQEMLGAMVCAECFAEGCDCSLVTYPTLRHALVDLAGESTNVDVCGECGNQYTIQNAKPPPDALCGGCRAQAPRS